MTKLRYDIMDIEDPLERGDLVKKRIVLPILLLLLISLFLVACGVDDLVGILDPVEIEVESEIDETESDELKVNRDGFYNTMEEVALYLHIYEELPANFITKREASDLGWESKDGNLWEVTDNKSLGGDKFGNREGLLPKVDGRIYYECDINYEGGFRGSERIVYSNDGLIYYTDDHYKSFKLIYGDE